MAWIGRFSAEASPSLAFSKIERALRRSSRSSVAASSDRGQDAGPFRTQRPGVRRADPVSIHELRPCQQTLSGPARQYNESTRVSFSNTSAAVVGEGPDSDPAGSSFPSDHSDGLPVVEAEGVAGEAQGGQRTPRGRGSSPIAHSSNRPRKRAGVVVFSSEDDILVVTVSKSNGKRK